MAKKQTQLTKEGAAPAAEASVEKMISDAAEVLPGYYDSPAAGAQGEAATAESSESKAVRACTHNPLAQPPECGFCFAPPDVIDGTRQKATAPQVIPSPAASLPPMPGYPQMVSIEDVMKMAAMMAKEIVAGMRAPTEEERIAKERKKAERNALIAEQRESKEREEQLKRNCPHMRADANGDSHSTIAAVHNYPDGLPRGICQMCQFWIQPGDPLFDRVVALHNSAMQSAA